jgi:DNA-binding NarL/FixJ family response regulator
VGVTRTAAKNGFKVCLVSAHTFFLTQFKDLLAGFDPQVYRLDGTLLGSDLSSLMLPRISVCVIDAATNPQITNALVSHIIEHYPKSQVLVLADKLDNDTAFPLLHCGIKGLLTYSEATEQLPRALEAVSSGGYWVPRPLLARFVDSILEKERNGGRRVPAICVKVSPREQQILAALLENGSNKEIANQLNISERTVKFHVSNLLAKYGVQRRADLILLSLQSRSVPTAQCETHSSVSGALCLEPFK